MTLAQLDRNYIWHPFTQEKNFKEPVIIEKGQGAYLYDTNGKKVQRGSIYKKCKIIL